jgi:hypothetical protein
MNVQLPEKEKISKKQIIIYVGILAFCIIAIIVAFYVQFYARIDIAKLIGIDKEIKFGNKTQEQTEQLKIGFDSLFTNNIINNNNEAHNNMKINTDQPLVYTRYDKQEKKNDSYDLNIKIPYINIKDDVIEQYNNEIEEIFATKVRSILESDKGNVIFNIDYIANIQDDILSIMIKSNLKEGTSAQRVIIQTYNYDLRNKKAITFDEILRIEQLDKQDIQNKIKQEIETQQQKSEDLEQLGYYIYQRDVSNKMYNIENVEQFYITEQVLYVIYPYGNDSITSETDIIII